MPLHGGSCILEHLPSGEIVEGRKEPEPQHVCLLVLNCVCVFALVHVYAGPCVHVCRGQNSTLGVVPQRSILFLFGF